MELMSRQMFGMGSIADTESAKADHEINAAFRKVARIFAPGKQELRKFGGQAEKAVIEVYGRVIEAREE